MVCRWYLWTVQCWAYCARPGGAERVWTILGADINSPAGPGLQAVQQRFKPAASAGGGWSHSCIQPQGERRRSPILQRPRKEFLTAALQIVICNLFRNAKDAVFLTAAFGVSSIMAEGLLHAPVDAFKTKYTDVPKHWRPTYLLLEGTGRAQSRNFVRAVRNLPHGHVAVGSYLPEDGLFRDHEAEVKPPLPAASC